MEDCRLLSGKKVFLCCFFISLKTYFKNLINNKFFAKIIVLLFFIFALRNRIE